MCVDVIAMSSLEMYIQLLILALCQSDAFYTFVIRTLCEKYRGGGNKPLDMVFVDLENAYDTVRYYGDACGNGTSQRDT